jgi:hypothetical protein
MSSNRVPHSIGWGMVSAVLVGVIPTAALAFDFWPAEAPVTPSLFGKVLGIDPLGFPALLLSVLWQLIYGGFWGAFLAYVTGPFRPLEEPLARPSMLLYGAGLGLFRFFIANLTVLFYIGWGPFSLLVSPFIALAILVSNLGFGLFLSWLVASEDAGLIVFHIPRLRIPWLRARMRSGRHQVTTTHVIRQSRWFRW